MRTLENVDIKGLRVLVRTDYDVPVDKEGNILNDFRIKNSLPTLRYILKRAKQVIIMCHMGRPDGKKVNNLTTDKVAIRLMKILGRNVAKLDDCIDVDIPDEKIVLLENLRFHKGEQENDEEFAKKLASLADVYVNDAFATAYREHASTVGVPKFLPSCAGLEIQKEVEHLNFKNAKKPLVVIMGGSKLSTKFNLINAMLPKVDKLLLGGAMIFSFYRAKGLRVGKSLYEKDQVVTAKLLLNNEKIVLPKDVVVASELSSNAKVRTVDFDKIPMNSMGVDIGPESLDEFKKILKQAKTVFWNGTMGVYEIEKFAKASYDLAKFLALLNAKVIVGGGDTSTVIDHLGIRDEFDHISTGGGSSLMLIEKGTLPGLEVLKN